MMTMMMLVMMCTADVERYDHDFHLYSTRLAVSYAIGVCRVDGDVVAPQPPVGVLDARPVAVQSRRGKRESECEARETASEAAKVTTDFSEKSKNMHSGLVSFHQLPPAPTATRRTNPSINKYKYICIYIYIYICIMLSLYRDCC